LKPSALKPFAISVLAFFSAAPLFAQFAPAPGTGPGLNETVEAIDSAGVTTRILYITAHPDDESAAVLTYLARGLHTDVALLSLTRGEGGQNVLGPEQAPQLGLIRTQELLAATHGYGVKLFFSSAKDFGYSKTPEETERIWGDQVLADMVRVIRTFRPNIVINNFGGVHSGHGHHQAAGIWTPQAVKLAADPSYGRSANSTSTTESTNESANDSSAELDAPWGSQDHPVQILDVDRSGGRSANQASLQLPLDEVSPLWGKTWREIGIDAFANHRTQGISGVLGSPFLHRSIALVSESGEKIDPATLSQPLYTLAGDGSPNGCNNGAAFCPVLKQAEDELQQARRDALELRWQQSSGEIASAANRIASLVSRDRLAKDNHPRTDQERTRYADIRAALQRSNHALALAAGLEVVAESDRGEVVAGESFTVDAHSRCRKEAGCELGKLQVLLRPEAEVTSAAADSSGTQKFMVTIHAPFPQGTPWEHQQPEPPALAIAIQQVTVAGHKFAEQQPVTHIAATSTRIDRVSVRMVPAYTLALEPDQAIELLARPKKPFDVLTRVHAYATKPAKIEVGLTVPQGWSVTSPVSLQFSGAGDQYAKLTVTPPARLSAGTYPLTAFAQRGEEKFSTSLAPLPSMPTLLWSQPAQCRVFAFDANVPDDLRVGYISAESEPIPQALERLGIQVEMLDAAALAFSNLARFDAIVVGVRGYELRPELAGTNQRLLDYVSSGGTLLVQYQRDFAWDKFQFAPYPAKISPEKPNSPLPRITDETSPVKFLKQGDPLLNRPNKITPQDFNGWIQERGLYFWSQYDAKYTSLLSMNDPGEADLNGGLVYTHYGKGTYIYTGLAFFRQIPEGVSGAYRVFINLLSASRETGRNPAQSLKASANGNSK
jgi:LmbE family N-acetylglucosaminyl deacetylase